MNTPSKPNIQASLLAALGLSLATAHADLTKAEKDILSKKIKLAEAKSREAESKHAAALPTVEVREEFGKFFNRPYSNTLGLSVPIPLWSSGKLYESHIDADVNALSGTNTPELLGKGIDKLKKVAEGAGAEWLTDYSHLGLGTSLSFENNKGSAVLLRIRKQFQFLNEDSDDASFSYLDDRQARSSGSRLEAAFMLDWYLDSLYNQKQFTPLGWIQQPYRFWIRTGFEIHSNDLPGKLEIDQRRWMALLNFQANPDQNARFLGINGAEITSPQIVQIGAVYEQNRITGNDDFHWIIGWAPVFHLLQEHGALTRGFGLNKRMYLGDSRPTSIESVKTVSDQYGEKTVVTVNPTEPPSGDPLKNWYFSINPSINALGASSARGIVDKLAGIRSPDALDKLQQEQLRWQVKALVGWNNGVFELSYAVNGSHPFSRLGDVLIGQEVRADINIPQWISPSAKDWRSLKGYVSYQRGKFEPNYEDIDLVTAGVSLRF